MERDQAHTQNELLKRIAVALEKNTANVVYNGELKNTKDMPGFEGTLDALDCLTSDFRNKALLHEQSLAPTSSNNDDDRYEVDGSSVGDGKYEDDSYTYDNDLNEYCDGIKNDSDHDIRSTAQYYEKFLNKFYKNDDLRTKKDCILDYVTNEFGITGARYTDIIKFAYYLGEHNAPKYDNANRGYYSCAFSPRMNGHLIQGGKDYLVKGINKEGDERYFSYMFVDQATDYWKYITAIH